MKFAWKSNFTDVLSVIASHATFALTSITVLFKFQRLESYQGQTAAASPAMRLSLQSHLIFNYYIRCQTDLLYPSCGNAAHAHIILNFQAQFHTHALISKFKQTGK
jgi:hypothetical protein